MPIELAGPARELPPTEKPPEDTTQPKLELPDHCPSCGAYTARADRCPNCDEPIAPVDEDKDIIEL